MSSSTTVSAGRCSTIRNLGRASFTVPPFLVQHLWRRGRLDDSTVTVDHLSEPPPDPSGIEPSNDPDVQAASDGVGPLVMRTYEVDIAGSSLDARSLMARLVQRPADLNDDRIAGFVRDDRPATDLTPGDELVVELPGPWNAPVRVTSVAPTELLLQTLDGHMEAGQIRFDTSDRGEPGAIGFRIRSWARGGDPTFTVLHLGLRIAKELQTAMWVAMCEGAVDVCGGHRVGDIRVRTEVLADSTPGGDGSALTEVGETLENVGGR